MSEENSEEISFSIQEIQEQPQEQPQELQELQKDIIQEQPKQKVPERVFIVPYRNRPQQKFFFCKQMSFLLEDADDYEIYFVHQNDVRYFNRGAMKNIGFLAMKEKYPDDYQNINFIFHDVDTLPFHKLFDYKTEEGIVKHYYGFETALGGIVVMKGSDFEKINGYPNYWGWGMEDACLQKRCFLNRIQIDRSQFYTIGSPEILQLFDGVSRLVSKKDPLRMKNDNGVDGIKTIRDLKYSLDNQSANPKDNEYVLESDSIHIVNVHQFVTGVSFQKDAFYEYDLRDPVTKIAFPDKQATQKTMISQEEWKQIPYNQQFQDMNSQIMQQQQVQELQQLAQQKRRQIMQQRQQQQQQQSAAYIFSQENARRINAEKAALKAAAEEEAKESIMKQREMMKSAMIAQAIAQSQSAYGQQRKGFNIHLGGLR
jgi:N-terminal region of glycosyl transferase group 7/N-terminal domain of galactosyltransferase